MWGCWFYQIEAIKEYFNVSLIVTGLSSISIFTSIADLVTLPESILYWGPYVLVAPSQNLIHVLGFWTSFFSFALFLYY